MPISNTQATIFTCVPEYVTKIWRIAARFPGSSARVAVEESSHCESPVVGVEVRVKFNKNFARPETQIPSAQDEYTDRYEAWNLSQTLWLKLSTAIQNELDAYNILIAAAASTAHSVTSDQLVPCRTEIVLPQVERRVHPRVHSSGTHSRVSTIRPDESASRVSPATHVSVNPTRSRRTSSTLLGYFAGRTPARR